MSSSTTSGHTGGGPTTVLACPSCGIGAGSGTRYCERCGTPLADNTTRYLAAAAHLDADYCNAALDEFMVERVRSVPPSPGADSSAVLRDAVSARSRRRIRDVLLVLILTSFAVTHLGLFVLWVIVAAIARAASGLGGGERASGRAALIVTTVVAAVLVVVLALAGIGGSVVAQLDDAGLRGIDGLAEDGTAALLWVMLLSALMLAVLAVDSYLVHWLVHTCFRRERFVAEPRGKRVGLELTLRTLGTGVREPELDRVAGADRDAVADNVAAVVVHRAFHPFIGSGTLTDHEGIAVSLEPEIGADAPKKIDVLGLHHHISMAMVELRTATSLGPGGRLADLEIREQVMASSDELVVHLATSTGHLILPSQDRPPTATVDLGRARELATDPAEWARYHRCYRVEAWDRDLTLSTYVHIGTDQKTLYFERVHCVLMPLAEELRNIDRPTNDLLPLGQAITSLVLLPASIPERIRGFFGAQPIRQRPGEIVPDRYGAAHSLRELASDVTQFRTYYQKADAFRYQEIIDRILLRSIGAYLEEHGYSAVEFQRAFSQTIYDYRGAAISNSAMGPNSRTTNSGPGHQNRNDRPPAGAKG